MYSYNESLGATQGNGGLIPTTVGSFEGSVGQGGPLVAIPAFTNANNTIMGMPVLDSVTNWGAMGAITGPNLHVYRIIINRSPSTTRGEHDTFERVFHTQLTDRKHPKTTEILKLLSKDMNS